jgi:hypothetical protein
VKIIPPNPEERGENRTLGISRSGLRPARMGSVGRSFSSRFVQIWLTGIVVLLVFLPGQVKGAEPARRNPNEIKAACLRNFAHYVMWPMNAFTNSDAPWHIGILGDDPFGEVLEKTLKGRTEQERPFAIFRADTFEKLPASQIVFIAYKDAAKRRAALSRLKNLPVLTVGDAPEFLQEGGIIRFQVTDRVEMSINLDQARAVSLTIPSKMLEVSRSVVSNGTESKLR